MRNGTSLPLVAGLGRQSIMLAMFLAILYLAGGASRATVLGQAVVRAAAFGMLSFSFLFGRRPVFANLRTVAVLLAMALFLPLLQLVPLPPSIWQMLPGRQVLIDAGQIAGHAPSWHALSMTPGATWNAAFSLSVPVTMLFLLASLNEREQHWLMPMFLVLVGALAMVGMIQFSGTQVTQSLINYNYGVTGTFANRNHFAVFLALGCLTAPAWALAHQQNRWRQPVAAGLVLILFLTILASGSRAGLAAGGISLVLGPLAVRERLQRTLRGQPRWVILAVIGAALLTTMLIGTSVVLGRAASIDRLLAQNVDTDMRARSLPTVMAMIRLYLPWGSGLGGFAPLFQLHEPFDLLKPTYFNQAHNDYLGIMLDAGLPGVALIAVAVSWWAYASQRVWRAKASGVVERGRVGAAMLALMLAASAVDYPVRTPLFMATAVLAAAWLGWANATVGQEAIDATSLPGTRSNVRQAIRVWGRHQDNA